MRIRPYIVVNSAGIAVAGPLEQTSVEEAKDQCRAVLPIMRGQGGGYIINIGSIDGLIAIPTSRFGIRVVIIEPGGTRTEITVNRRMAAATTDHSVYPSFAAALKRTASDDEQNGPGPEGVAGLPSRIVNTSEPRLRYTVRPTTQRAAVWLKRLLPFAVMKSAVPRE